MPWAVGASNARPCKFTRYIVFLVWLPAAPNEGGGKNVRAAATNQPVLLQLPQNGKV